jgi:hypothetical protein
MALQHERLSQLRNQLIPYAREAEHSSQWRAVSVARANGHAMGDELPTVKQVKQRLSVEWPELNRVDDPERLQRVLDWELRRGLTTDAKIMRMRRPDLSEEECQAEVMENLAAQSEVNHLKASRELDPASEMQDPNEATGSMGGRPPNETEEND